MSDGQRWVYGVADGRSHLLADAAAGTSTVVTMCGLVLPASVMTFSVPPNLDVCADCGRCGALRVGPPRFPGHRPTPP